MVTTYQQSIREERDQDRFGITSCEQRVSFLLHKICIRTAWIVAVVDPNHLTKVHIETDVDSSECKKYKNKDQPHFKALSP